MRSTWTEVQIQFKASYRWTCKENSRREARAARGFSLWRLVSPLGYSLRSPTVARTTKTLEQILRGTSDANVAFAAMRKLLADLGFQERIKGSHHIFSRTGIEEILNLQSKGSKCKPYQVKQVRSVILRYKLAGIEDA